MDLEKKHRERTLLSLLENWQENLGAGNLTSTMLIELSKAYDNILKTSGENERAAVEKSSKFASEFFIGSK